MWTGGGEGGEGRAGGRRRDHGEEGGGPRCPFWTSRLTRACCSARAWATCFPSAVARPVRVSRAACSRLRPIRARPRRRWSVSTWWRRSEEHTSELQSQSNLVCRLLLEKKKTNIRRVSHRLSTRC